MIFRFNSKSFVWRFSIAYSYGYKSWKTNMGPRCKWGQKSWWSSKICWNKRTFWIQVSYTSTFINDIAFDFVFRLCSPNACAASLPCNFRFCFCFFALFNFLSAFSLLMVLLMLLLPLLILCCAVAEQVAEQVNCNFHLSLRSLWDWKTFQSCFICACIFFWFWWVTIVTVNRIQPSNAFGHEKWTKTIIVEVKMCPHDSKLSTSFSKYSFKI